MAKFTYPDGKTEEVEMKAGQVAWFPPVEHLPENAGGDPKAERAITEAEARGHAAEK